MLTLCHVVADWDMLNVIDLLSRFVIYLKCYLWSFIRLSNEFAKESQQHKFLEKIVLNLHKQMWWYWLKYVLSSVKRKKITVIQKIDCQKQKQNKIVEFGIKFWQFFIYMSTCQCTFCCTPWVSSPQMGTGSHGQVHLHGPSFSPGPLAR